MTKNADSLSKESMELKGMKAKDDLICPMEVGSDPVKGSSAKRVPWKVKSGSCQERGSKPSVEMEIPGFAIDPEADTKTQDMKQGALNNNKEAPATETPKKTEGWLRPMGVTYVKDSDHTGVCGMQALRRRSTTTVKDSDHTGVWGMQALRRRSTTTKDIRMIPSGHSKKIADKDKSDK